MKNDCFKRPSWLHKKRPLDARTHQTASLISRHGCQTVCQSARCPNLSECYARGAAAFLIMGPQCTRRCLFCQIHVPGTSAPAPAPLDPREPERVAIAARDLALKHIVVTSVTRDDLPDGGLAHFAETVCACRQTAPAARVEILTPDFQGRADIVARLSDTPPDVFNHNIETVQRLQARVRPRASYETSLRALSAAKKFLPANVIIKSGLMVGLGETDDEILEAMRDLVEYGVDMITIGQYLRPSRRHMPVARYVTPAQFDFYRQEGEDMGLRYVYAGPYVRSSYMAEFYESHKFPQPGNSYGNHESSTG